MLSALRNLGVGSLGPPRGFLALWLTFCVLLTLGGYAAGLAPAAVAEAGDALFGFSPSRDSAVVAAPNAQGIEGPPHLIVPRLGLNAPIIFPENRDLETLDDALTHGVVHYPGSALPNGTGGVFLFGHSTGLSVVHNRAFAIFNGLDRIRNGDTVRVRFGGREYWYQVTSVEAKTMDEAEIDISAGGRRLILVTCRTFGAKDDRTIVTAKFVKSYPLRVQAAADSSP